MYKYLALGDSYTIGEQVPAHENFPNHLHRLLVEVGLNISAPKIIAQTGWTTDELKQAIEEQIITDTYSIVSLLIGVNNQYRGHNVEEYKVEFETLLKMAINFAGGHPDKVFVLSIPDWGKTPFALDKGKNPNEVSKEIDDYNTACKCITLQHHAHYVYITESTQAHANKEGFLTNDGLHPSGKEYELWAQLLKPLVIEELLEQV